MNKIIEGTKVKYNDIDTEIEAVSKQFSTNTFKYKLKNITNLLDFSEFFIKTEETIVDVKDDINEALGDIENIIKDNKKTKKSK